MSGKHGVREINTASKGQEHNSRLDPFTTWQILLGGSEITHSKDNWGNYVEILFTVARNTSAALSPYRALDLEKGRRSQACATF